jgi:hypothetical protein
MALVERNKTWTSYDLESGASHTRQLEESVAQPRRAWNKKKYGGQENICLQN